MFCIRARLGGSVERNRRGTAYLESASRQPRKTLPCPSPLTSGTMGRESHTSRSWLRAGGVPVVAWGAITRFAVECSILPCLRPVAEATIWVRGYVETAQETR